jgi:hypothetical protein
MQPNLNMGGLSGSDPLSEAIAARGGGQTGLNQQSPQAPGYKPTLPPNIPSGSSGMPQMQSQGKPATSEAELILKAMSQRLSSISKVEQSQTNLQKLPVM